MEIRVATHGHVVLLTLDNQPRMNAMTRAMMADLSGCGTSWSVVRAAASC